jgi:L-lysine 2,3-aminomutase
VITNADVKKMMDHYGYSEEIRRTIGRERLLPSELLSRLQDNHPDQAGFLRTRDFMFTQRKRYAGLEGFRSIVDTLKRKGIEIGHLEERELFIRVYRFMATDHVLNAINWDDFENDPLFSLVFPQPGMIRKDTEDAYLAADTEEERQEIVDGYMAKTNPHGCNQLLNKPWFEDSDGRVEFVEGSQHKYPQCALVFDSTTQDCFAFCTYCFRHAQVRGDEDMFCQRDPGQLLQYLKLHPEATDILITGGDAGFMPVERLREYVVPIMEDPDLRHVRTVRLGTRMLTYLPEMVLSDEYDEMLELFDTMYDNGVQLAWMAHFSTPREVLNPSTIAAVRRLQRHHVTMRSQSPMMDHVSLFRDRAGRVDVGRTAKNWVDLALVLGTMHIGFHSMYLARPTGEHHYFTTPLADVAKIADKIHRDLASIYRPSRYISMTSSAGKISLLGTVEVDGKKAFALKFTQGRNMEWMDGVFLAKYDEQQCSIDKLEPFEGREFFFRQDQRDIEASLLKALEGRKFAGDE